MTEDERFALLFGIMLGDGCLSRFYPKDRKERRVIVITGSLEDDKNFFEDVLVPLLKSFTRNSVKIKNKSYCGSAEIQISDNDLFAKIMSFGFPVGKKGPDIFIPSYFYERGLVKYVIQGFFATDGSLVLTKNPNKFYPRVEGNGISKKLIIQIVDYLVNLGMNGHFYESKRKKVSSKFNRKHKAYRFQFNGMENLLLFNGLIGFVNPKQEEKYLRFLEYSKKYDRLVGTLPLKKQKFLREQVNTFLRT